MPFVNIQILKGHPQARKDEISRRVTEAISEVAQLPKQAVWVVFDTPAATCRARNAARDRPVPASVLGLQLHRMRDIQRELEAEGCAAQIEQDEDAVRAGIDDRSDRLRDPRGTGAEAPVVGPPGRPDRDIRTGDLGDHLAEALGDLRAVGDEDETDHAVLRAGRAGDGPMLCRNLARRKQEIVSIVDGCGFDAPVATGPDCRSGSSLPTLGRSEPAADPS